jgi:integrase
MTSFGLFRHDEEVEMPKLPKGLYKKGPSYYRRDRRAGRDRWVCLGRDYREASRRLKESKAVNRSGPAITVQKAASDWLETYVKTARNPKGVALAGTRVTKYLNEFMGARPLDSITADDLRKYRLWLASTKFEGNRLAEQTIAHVLSDARCFFGWCEDGGLLPRSPVPRRLLPRIQEKPPDRFTDSEMDVLVDLPEPHGFVVRLGLATGLRWGEMCRAQASDVDGDVLLVYQTKSGRLRRVPLPHDLAMAVRGRVGKLVPLREVSSGSFNRTVRRLSGIQGFRVKQLRHTFACRWVERRGNLEALQRVLGHASITTTQRYARLTDQFVRAEARRVAGE